ncbi:MAG: outer membrane lipoprotein-sorting protein [Bacteroidetes bacterium]|nr:outer membrane lipoprotein-sorting protein [Bacteroidota bacterium]
MYKLSLIILLFIFQSANLLFAQLNADEIFGKVLQKRGSGEKINTLKITGRMTFGGVTGTFVIYNKKPFLNRMDLELMDKKIIQGINAKEGWFINEIADQNTAQRMPNETYERTKTQNFYMLHPLENYKSKGIKLEYKGESKVDSVDSFVITIIMQDSSKADMYIDSKNFVQLLQKTEVKQPESKDVIIESSYKDYKDIGGLLIPYFMEAKTNGQSQSKMLIEKVEVNIDIDDSIFALPVK